MPLRRERPQIDHGKERIGQVAVGTEGAMMRQLVRRVSRLAAASAVLSQAAVAETGYQLVSASLEGRDVIVFLDGAGTAVAVEMDDARAQVLTGLAAGALLSDVEAARGADRPAFKLDQATGSGLAALIDGMGRLSDAQKNELRRALAI